MQENKGRKWHAIPGWGEWRQARPVASGGSSSSTRIGMDARPASHSQPATSPVPPNRSRTRAFGSWRSAGGWWPSGWEWETTRPNKQMARRARAHRQSPPASACRRAPPTNHARRHRHRRRLSGSGAFAPFALVPIPLFLASIPASVCLRPKAEGPWREPSKQASGRVRRPGSSTQPAKAKRPRCQEVAPWRWRHAMRCVQRIGLRTRGCRRRPGVAKTKSERAATRATRLLLACTPAASHACWLAATARSSGFALPPSGHPIPSHPISTRARPLDVFVCFAA